MSTPGKSVYIGGKVTGLPEDEVRRKFKYKALQLSAEGYKVFNPVQFVSDNNLTKASWEAIMRECIAYMMVCDEVHLLPCWKNSRGARLERNLALRLGIPIVYYTN